MAESKQSGPRKGQPLRRFVRRHPNLLAAGFGLFCVLLLAVLFEGGFWLLNGIKPPEPKVRYEFKPEYRRPDPVVGVWGMSDVQGRHIRYVDEGLAFDAVYTLDHHGRRVTPAAPPGGARPRHLLFFGGSFTFGSGVADEETLPNHAAELAPGYQPYNYAFQGHSPQHMLARFEADTLRGEVDQAEGICVFVFIPDHVRRVIGSKKVVCRWAYGKQFPCYEFDGAGGVRNLGTLAGARPWTQRFYEWLEDEQCLRFFGADWPVILSDGDYELTAAVIKASAEAYREQFGSDRFHVVLYPGDVRYTERSPSGTRMAPFLEAAGIPCFDYTDVFDLGEAGYSIVGDGHPTGKAHRLIAERLVRDLKLNE